MNRSGGLLLMFGLALAAYSSWCVVRGPYFGGTLPSFETIVLAVASFVIGMLFVGRGISRMNEPGNRGRPNLEDQRKHTPEQFFER